jgi:hypothetical protein
LLRFNYLLGSLIGATGSLHFRFNLHRIPSTRQPLSVNAAARKIMRNLFIGGALALLASSSLANANTLQGSIWENQPGAAGNATIANIPNTAPNVTFTINSPIFMTSGNAYTIQEFLASQPGGFSVQTGASELPNTLGNTFFEFTGTVSVTNGQTFTAGHDDGLQLKIGNLLVIDTPQPTSFAVTTVTYNGPSGNLPFVLVYGECCGPPAALEISLPLSSAVPEPATWGMMLLGFAGLGFAFRQSRRKASFA